MKVSVGNNVSVLGEKVKLEEVFLQEILDEDEEECPCFFSLW